MRINGSFTIVVSATAVIAASVYFMKSSWNQLGQTYPPEEKQTAVAQFFGDYSKEHLWTLLPSESAQAVPAEGEARQGQGTNRLADGAAVTLSNATIDQLAQVK